MTTESTEHEPLDHLIRDNLAPQARAVADTLDDWIMRRFGKTSSHHGAGLFLDLLADEGYQVVPKPPPFEWHYGPTATDPDPGRMWHTGCGREVLYIEYGLLCECGAPGSDDD